MATDLDTLIAAEKGQKDALEKDIAKGTSAQASLAQVQAVLADLSAIALRRAGILGDADARLAAAKASAASVTTGLAAVGAMLSKLPGTLKLTDLDAIVIADLPSPPDPTKKKYADYVSALALADGALATASTAVVKARDTEAASKVAIDRAEAALQDAVGVAVKAAEAAKSALADALSAKDAGDFAGAYWANARAKTLVATVTAADITNAKKALQTAIDASADAIDLRLKAEADLVQKQADRSNAGDQLGSAASQVSKKLADAVIAAKAGP